MDAASAIGENGRMRIIAGKWRSRRIVRPGGRATRPMPDRVKEAIFSMLASHFGYAGSLPAFPVADVFSGGGTMGLEALSRGASHCTFFERDRLALAALAQNRATLDAAGCSRIVRADAWRTSPLEAAAHAIQLIFLDPPYPDSKDSAPGGAVMRYLAHVERAGTPEEVGANAVQTGDLIIVLHHPAKVSYDVSTMPAWRILDNRRFGSSGVTLFQK